MRNMELARDSVGNNKDRYYAVDHVFSKLLSDGGDNRHLGLGKCKIKH
jgi:hypothetical protein